MITSINMYDLKKNSRTTELQMEKTRPLYMEHGSDVKRITIIFINCLKNICPDEASCNPKKLLLSDQHRRRWSGTKNALGQPLENTKINHETGRSCTPPPLRPPRRITKFNILDSPDAQWQLQFVSMPTTVLEKTKKNKRYWIFDSPVLEFSKAALPWRGSHENLKC